MSKKFDIESLVRPNILALKPYRSARNDFNSGILLDANENPIGPPFEDNGELNRYPMPYQEKLRSKIASFRKVQQKHVFVGVGSDEAIDLLFRIFCTPSKDRALITPPTYGMYRVSAGINDVAVDEVLLTPEFQLDVDQTLSKVTEHTKILFLCSPNNPTGNSLKRTHILRLIEEFDGIVVVDEAYIDFSEQHSFAEEVENFSNLVVLQTLSKAFGLAGIRLGIAIAHPEVIQLMMKVKAPYNINKLTSEAALKGLSNIDAVKANVEIILEERNRVAEELSLMENVDKVYPTDANFLIFKLPNALEIYKNLAEHGVIVRYRGNEPHCENCLRLTIGTSEENDRFLTVLKQLIGNRN